MRAFTAALLALGVALVHAAPQNQAAGPTAQETETTAVVGMKGDPETVLSQFQSDDAMVTTCLKGEHCALMTVGQAKGLSFDSIASIYAPKGQNEISQALSPTLATMAESLRSLQEQKEQLKALEASMEALTSASSKGQALNQEVQQRFTEMMSKAAVLPAAAPNYKGAALAPALQSKGASYAAPASKGASYAAPPSKGSYASTMQYESVMCPMTVYELGKSQKYGNEMKLQLESSNSVNARLMAEKSRLEAALASMEMLKNKAEAQAAFNAKYAAEQKSQAEMLSNALTVSNAEKALLRAQKNDLEVQLGTTQQLLSMEKAENERLSQSLSDCNDAKNDLTIQLATQTTRAEKAEQELAETKARLEEETETRITCEENLSFTERRLKNTEANLDQEREIREQTEAELTQTMVDLASCQKETRVLTSMLSRTQDELQEKIAALAREEEAHRLVQEKLDDTTEELRATQAELRNTKRALEDEQNAHATTQRILANTQEQLESTEAARQALEEAKEQLENELAETKSQLEIMTAERDQLQTTLDATSAALAETTALKMQCESSLAAQTAISEQLREQLAEALVMLKMEKDAREELAATIALVQETSRKVQQEVIKLQEENALLQAQVEKLRSEQEVALALAVGCPPTYEKFGSSCYKYVREKTQWKNAQEQCMKDGGNLVGIETAQEQLFLTNYLKRHGAVDAYSYTGGLKYSGYWKWIGQHAPMSQSDFWLTAETQSKPGYDCQAMFIHDPFRFGQWVGLPCYSSVPYVCEYQLLPAHAAVQNQAERMAVLKMAEDAPGYLQSAVLY